MPGSIDSAGSRGTNKLIKQGAKLIENTDDIIEEILPQIEVGALSKSTPVSNNEDPERKLSEVLNEVGKKILNSVSKKSVHIDDLISSTGLPSADILSELTTMELKGIIQQNPGKFFSLKK